MSTKYYGYRVKNTSVEDVFNQLKSQYNVCNDIFHKQIQKQFVKYIYEMIDNALIKKSNKTMSIENLADTYQHLVFDTYMHNIIYEFEIFLFPYKRDVFIMNNSDYIYKSVIDTFNWEDYSYWNNTDKPDDISTREWNGRLKKWDLLCPDYPRNCALIYRPNFNHHKNLPFLWKYEELKEWFDKFNAEYRMEKYRSDYEFTQQYFGKVGDFKFKNKELITITEKNYDEKFKVSLEHFCF
jgi:hypothetical protein